METGSDVIAFFSLAFSYTVFVSPFFLVFMMIVCKCVATSYTIYNIYKTSAIK